MLGFSNEWVSITETDKYCRVGRKDKLSLMNNKSLYHKRVGLPYTRTVKLIDSDGNLVAIEAHTEQGDIIETIQNRGKGTTIVIIRDLEGNKYKGTSKCNRKEDTYSSQDGYTIAYARAQIKKYEAILKSEIE